MKEQQKAGIRVGKENGTADRPAVRKGAHAPFRGIAGHIRSKGGDYHERKGLPDIDCGIIGRFGLYRDVHDESES